MESALLTASAPDPAPSAEPAAPPADLPADLPTDRAQPPRLDLSAMEPPRKLAEARLEEVTIDGICGVY